MNRGKIIAVTIALCTATWAQSPDSTRIADSLAVSNVDSSSLIESILGLTDDASDALEFVAADSAGQDSTFSLPVTAVADSDSTVLSSEFSDSTGDKIELSDSAAVSAEASDSALSETIADELPDSLRQPVEDLEPADLSLGYGYKGYRWGTPSHIQPRITAITEPFYSRDSSSVSYRTTLGQDTVLMSYFYSDSGFWKVEISYPLDPFDQKEHDEKFKEISQIINLLYANPTSSSLSITGPMATSSNPLDIDYSRMYQHNSWQVGPVQIELLLISFVQDTETIFPVISSTTQLVLAYYNPDYMIRVEPQQPVDTGPSVFDLY